MSLLALLEHVRRSTGSISETLVGALDSAHGDVTRLGRAVRLAAMVRRASLPSQHRRQSDRVSSS